jgi:hypothetical protein
MGGTFIAVVLAFPRGIAGLVTDQLAPFVGRLARRESGRAEVRRAENPSPAE